MSHSPCSFLYYFVLFCLCVCDIRRFLSPFRLPGEAQKIDRMMEKFAERYFAHNPNTGFGNAGKHQRNETKRNIY